MTTKKSSSSNTQQTNQEQLDVVGGGDNSITIGGKANIDYTNNLSQEVLSVLENVKDLTETQIKSVENVALENSANVNQSISALARTLEVKETEGFISILQPVLILIGIVFITLFGFKYLEKRGK